MGYDVFTKGKDKNAPRWSQSYDLTSQLIEEPEHLRPLFEAPVEIVNHQEIRKFESRDARLDKASNGLEIFLRDYVPTNNFEEIRVSSPYPKELIKGAAYSLKNVIDYARKHKLTLFIEG